MKKDSSIVDMGGFVVENVTKTIDSSNGQVKIIETHKLPGNGIIHPEFFLYGLLFAFLAIAIIILGWYYLKKKAEIAKLMIQNNMSPVSLFRQKSESKVGGFLKFGIIFIAMGIALLINVLLMSVFLYMYMAPVLFLCMGIALLVIHRLNKN
jgi:hypothetical protein